MFNTSELIWIQIFFQRLPYFCNSFQNYLIYYCCWDIGNFVSKFVSNYTPVRRVLLSKTAVSINQFCVINGDFYHGIPYNTKYLLSPVSKDFRLRWVRHSNINRTDCQTKLKLK